MGWREGGQGRAATPSRGTGSGGGRALKLLPTVKNTPQRRRGQQSGLQRASARLRAPAVAPARKHTSAGVAVTFPPSLLTSAAAACVLPPPLPPLAPACLQDIFDKIAVETGNLARYNKKPTVTSREIQTAVRLILPGECGMPCRAATGACGCVECLGQSQVRGRALVGARACAAAAPRPHRSQFFIKFGPLPSPACSCLPPPCKLF